MRFRRVNPSYSSHAFEAINVTPLIDVVMCLIIFFLIVGKLATERGMFVKLPQTGVGSEETSQSVLVITIAKLADAQAMGVKSETAWSALGIAVQVDGQPVEDSKALENAVRSRIAEHNNASVQVRADRELAYGSVEPVLRAAGMGGARSVRLATERLP